MESPPCQPTISRLGNRLAFEVFQYDLNIWRVDLKGPGKEPSQPIRFISSTQIEQYPAYSPDGRRIAFMSERSGTDEIWICDSDGSKTMQLTSFGGAAIYGPSWSPDNQKVALTVAQKGMKEDIYVVSASGGVPRRMTTDPAEDKWPYWSQDGKWIYFSSTRSGREEIWKMPSSGGEAVQITRNSGDIPARITRRQIPLLHEGVARRRKRLENLSGWKSRSESARFCAQRSPMDCGQGRDLLLQTSRQNGTQ